MYLKAEIFYDTNSTYSPHSSSEYPVRTIHFPTRNKEYEDYLNKLCERYNVPESRLATQLALFLRNCKEGKDKADIYNYFSPYDLIRWQYRDSEKLQLDIENNKLNEFEIQLIKDLNEV